MPATRLGFDSVLRQTSLLDENAVRAVRGWQFIPAKDAARRPVATWITIATVFRLF